MAAVTLVDMHTSVGELIDEDISRSYQFSIASLPQPGGNYDEGITENQCATPSMREYMLVSSRNGQSAIDIFEIQRALPHNGKYASHFVGSRVVSNGSLHVTSRMDPLFFALAHFHRTMSSNIGTASDGKIDTRLQKWQPWDQALADLPPVVLRALNLDPKLSLKSVNDAGQLAHLLDVSDMCGDDLILCKFSEDRTLKWLVKKYESAADALRTRILDHKVREVKRRNSVTKSNDSGGNGAFCSSFHIGEEDQESMEEEKKAESQNHLNQLDHLTLTKEENMSVRLGAMQLIGEYLPRLWAEKLSSELLMPEADWVGKKKAITSSEPEAEGGNIDVAQSSGQKRSRSSWEGNLGQEDADNLLQYTLGSVGRDPASVITPSGKSEVANAKSSGLKRLAKVNTKGMKSLASFFGATKRRN
ncbi:hypothetical protein ACHAXS_002345 [Conticribra weissflogii]